MGVRKEWRQSGEAETGTERLETEASVMRNLNGKKMRQWRQNGDNVETKDRQFRQKRSSVDECK